MKDSPGGGYRSALRHRDFAILMARYVISGMGSWAYVVALIAFVYEQTESPTWVAVTSVARLAPQFLLSSYAGVIAERFERTRVMLVSDLGALVAMSGLVAVAVFDAPAVIAIILSAVTASMTIIEEPAVAALVPQVVGEEDLAAANGLRGIIDNLNVIVGPAVGAGLLLVAGAAGTFAINAASFAVAALLVTRLRVRSTPTDVTEGGQAGMLAQLGVGVKAITQSSSAFVLVMLSVVGAMVWGIDTVVFPVLGTRLGLGATGFGYLLTGLGVGGVLAGFAVNRVAHIPRLGSVIGVATMVLALATAAMSLVVVPAGAFGVQVVRGIAVMIADVLTITALQRSLPPDRISRVFGAFLTLQIGAMVLGAMVTPGLLNLLTLSGTLIATGIAVALSVVLSVPRLLAIDRDAVHRLQTLAPRISLFEVLDIFEHAPRTVLERLAAAAEETAAEPRQVIVKEGDVADALYVLVSGEVAVSARGEAGSSRRLRTMNAPTYFGEIGLLEGVPRTATVKALTPCVLYRIPGDLFLEALTSTPATATFISSAQARFARTHPSRVRAQAAAATKEGAAQ